MNSIQNHAYVSTNKNGGKNKMRELLPEQQPLPMGSMFSCPARYHTAGQTFQVGDLCWYEIQCGNGSSDYIQWGEATVMEVLPRNTYRLAGKTWKYDHFTHPLIGLPGGPPQYMNIADIHNSRRIYQQWASSSHPSSHVRRSALSGVDEVMHPALASVPGEAMFKVWDRETKPPCPVPSLRQGEQIEGRGEGEGERQQQQQKTYSLEDARKLHGDDLQFKGMKQNGMGPEFWGITLDQLMKIKELPGYNADMTMYDVVTQLLKPITSGKGMGYALLLNKEKPLRAIQMVSHAWEEKFSHFVEALNDSYCSGPFWVCATAIYQEDAEVIAKQLGPSLEHGPFATVLKQATDMIAVFTPEADIYLRMWCVFEILVAVKYGVNIQFAAFNRQIMSGIENIYDAIYAHGKERCNSKDARCSNASDEAQIRDLINAQDGKFDMLDAVVEWCKATYYMNQVSHPGIAFKSPPAHIMLLGGQRKLDYLAKTLSSVALAIDRIDDLEFFLEHSVASRDSPLGKNPHEDLSSGTELNDVATSFRASLHVNGGMEGNRDSDNIEERLLLNEDHGLEESKGGDSHEEESNQSEVLSQSQLQSDSQQGVEETRSAPPTMEIAVTPEGDSLSRQQELISSLPLPVTLDVKKVKFSPVTPMTTNMSSNGRKVLKKKRHSSVERMRQLYDQSSSVSARRDEGRKRRSDIEYISESRRSSSTPRRRRPRDQSEREKVNVTRMRQLYDQSKSVSARQEEGRKKRSSVERTIQKREIVRTGKFLHKESKRITSVRKKNDENRLSFKEKLEKKPNKMTVDQARSTYDRLLTYKKRTEDRRAVLKKEREARELAWTRAIGKIPPEQASRMYYQRSNTKKNRSKNSVQSA